MNHEWTVKFVQHRVPKSITATFGERALADLPAMLRPALEGLLRQIDALSQHIGDYDQRLGELAAQRHPEVKRLPVFRASARSPP